MLTNMIKSIVSIIEGLFYTSIIIGFFYFFILTLNYFFPIWK